MRPDSDLSLAPKVTVTTSSFVSADLEALTEFSTQLKFISEDCSAMALRCEGIASSLPTRFELSNTVDAQVCRSHLAALTFPAYSPSSLRVVAARAEMLAMLLTLSSTTYDMAEANALGLTVGMRAGYDATKIVATILKISAGVVGPSPLWQSGRPIKNDLTDILPMIGREVSSLPSPMYSLLMSSVASGLRYSTEPKPLIVKLNKSSSQQKGGTHVRSVSQAFRTSAELYKGPGNAANIQVQRTIDPKTGRGSWVVMVPGTRGGLGGAQPMDWISNFELAGGKDSDSSRAVEGALRLAMKKEGVATNAEPVMIVGHSQGGLVAAHLANKHASGKDFNITHIATDGSPIGHTKIPGKTRVLSIEQKGDTVPNLDGYATGDGARNRIRVEIDNPNAKFNSQGKAGLVEAHDATRYAYDYERWRERSSDPFVNEYEKSAAGFFAAGTSRTYRFSATRTDPKMPGPEVPKQRTLTPRERYGVPSYAYDRPTR